MKRIVPDRIFRYSVILLGVFILFFSSAIVSYQITLRGEMVTLPDLTGKTVAEAEIILMKNKLTLVKSGTELHASMEADKIVSQDPLPGSRININKVVKVTLSAGQEKIVLPDFVGRSLPAVSQQLITIGLRKGRVAHVHTPSYAAGKIIAQSPAPNEEVGRESKILFLVSQGDREKRYLMPDLIGKRAQAVIQRLKEMEFIVGHIRYSYYPGLESGYIINQYPGPGSRIQRRNLITLEVSK